MSPNVIVNKRLKTKDLKLHPGISHNEQPIQKFGQFGIFLGTGLLTWGRVVDSCSGNRCPLKVFLVSDPDYSDVWLLLHEA